MSSISRIYQAVPLAVKQGILLDEKASHHLARVLRCKVGDVITLFNGDGGEYSAVIVRIDKKNIYAEIQQFKQRDTESPVNVILAQGIARGEKMDFIMQKAVELGAKQIVPLVTERCNVRLDNEREEKRLQHWQSVVISACEQSGRNILPYISAPKTLREWVPQVRADKCFVLSPHVHEKLASEKLAASTSIVILIGPEGGLSDSEVEFAQQHGFKPLNLGPRVLRTETATLAALAVLQFQYGDFS